MLPCRMRESWIRFVSTDNSTMRLPVSALALLVACPALAEETAAFVKGTYAMEGRCAAWEVIENGGDRNAGTVPETLTSKGFDMWEGGCSFVSIKETVKGRQWVAKMACAEAADESEEVDTFDLDPATGNITVAVEGKTSVFVRCDAAKGN